MAMIAGSFLTVKLFQEMFDQQVLNVYHFRVDEIDPANANDYTPLAHGIYNFMSDQLRSFQSSQLAYLRCTIDQFESLDFGNYVPAVPIVGAAAFDPLPIFTAASIQYQQASKITRNGYKRIAGLTDTAVSGNDLSPATISDLNGFIENCLNVDGSTYQFINSTEDNIGECFLRPIIVGTQTVENPDFRYQVPAGVSVQSRVTSQNTRKVGRGS